MCPVKQRSIWNGDWRIGEEQSNPHCPCNQTPRLGQCSWSRRPLETGSYWPEFGMSSADVCLIRFFLWTFFFVFNWSITIITMACLVLPLGLVGCYLNPGKHHVLECWFSRQVSFHQLEGYCNTLFLSSFCSDWLKNWLSVDGTLLYWMCCFFRKGYHLEAI